MLGQKLEGKELGVPSAPTCPCLGGGFGGGVGLQAGDWQQEPTIWMPLHLVPRRPLPSCARRVKAVIAGNPPAPRMV